MGALLSQLEDQNEKFEKRLWTIERQVAFLSKMYAEMERREGHSDAAEEQAHPQYSFTEWLLIYGHQDESSEHGVWMIEEADVVDWLKRCGLEDYI